MPKKAIASLLLSIFVPACTFVLGAWVVFDASIPRVKQAEDRVAVLEAKVAANTIVYAEAVRFCAGAQERNPQGNWKLFKSLAYGQEDFRFCHETEANNLKSIPMLVRADP